MEQGAGGRERRKSAIRNLGPAIPNRKSNTCPDQSRRIQNRKFRSPLRLPPPCSQLPAPPHLAPPLPRALPLENRPVEIRRLCRAVLSGLSLSIRKAV